jgi:hypothetical protein
MKICLVGPGIMSIPPTGWGAVEMLIWDYYQILTKNNITVDIVNTPNKREILNKVNSNDYDVVHVHYDVFSDLMPILKAKVKIISSHYPYINNPDKHRMDGYQIQLNNIVKNNDFQIFASSQNDINTFVSFGAKRENTFLSKLGINYLEYDYLDQPIYDRTLCFSRIESRKRQFLIQSIDEIDFFGRKEDSNFTNLKNYKGEVPRDFLNKEITKYSNFILISSVENTTPLVVKEALVCGLGVVVSETVALELDQDLDFITVIEESRVNDIDYLKDKIERNKEISKTKRDEIRAYGISKFDVENILMNEYIEKIKTLL